MSFSAIAVGGLKRKPGGKKGGGKEGGLPCSGVGGGGSTSDGILIRTEGVEGGRDAGRATGVREGGGSTALVLYSMVQYSTLLL